MSSAISISAYKALALSNSALSTINPATHALWFYAPGTGNNCKSDFYGQPLSGRYKNHCFYKPIQGMCKELY